MRAGLVLCDHDAAVQTPTVLQYSVPAVVGVVDDGRAASTELQ